jgi:hypothetical protein
MSVARVPTKEDAVFPTSPSHRLSAIDIYEAQPLLLMEIVYLYWGDRLEWYPFFL